MKLNRVILHPILNDRRGIRLLAVYIFISIIVGSFFFNVQDSLFEAAGIDLTDPNLELDPLEKILGSSFYRIGFIFLVAFFAASITNAKIKGPVERIEKWLGLIEKKILPQSITIRKNDKMKNFVSLLNKIHELIQKYPE